MHLGGDTCSWGRCSSSPNGGGSRSSLTRWQGDKAVSGWGGYSSGWYRAMVAVGGGRWRSMEGTVVLLSAMRRTDGWMDRFKEIPSLDLTGGAMDKEVQKPIK